MEENAPLALGDPTDGCGPLLKSAHDAGRTLRQEIFEYVRGRGQAARKDVTDYLKISAGSTTTITADLIASGFLHEVEGKTRESARGRPRIALKVTAEAAYVIGIKLAFKVHTAVLTDFSGKLIGSQTLPARDTRRSVAQLVDETATLVEQLLQANSKSIGDIDTIGVGLPGIVDYKTKRCLWSSLLLTQDEDLAGMLSARLQTPVVLDNDANMLALAVLWFGAGRQLDDFAVVTIEGGVGMGLVLGNKLYRGAHGKGLELGHTKVEMDGALCQCGRRGCLEAYLADFALVRETATALAHRFDLSESPEHILETLFAEATADSPAALEIFHRTGRYLALGLSNVVQLFDPELICLSLGKMRYECLYADDVLKEMYRLSLDDGRKPCKVTFNMWDDLFGARGASAQALAATTDSLIGGEAHEV